jgi:hypothetical protein
MLFVLSSGSEQHKVIVATDINVYCILGDKMSPYFLAGKCDQIAANKEEKVKKFAIFSPPYKMALKICAT